MPQSLRRKFMTLFAPDPLLVAMVRCVHRSNPQNKYSATGPAVSLRSY